MVSVKNIVLCGPSSLSPCRLVLIRVSKTAHGICMNLRMATRSSSLVMSGDPSSPEGHLESPEHWLICEQSSALPRGLHSFHRSQVHTWPLCLLPAWTQTLAILQIWNQDPAGEWDSGNIRVRVKVFQPCLYDGMSYSHLPLVPHSCLCFFTPLHVAGCSPDAFSSLCFSFPFSGLVNTCFKSDSAASPASMINSSFPGNFSSCESIV